MEPIYSMTTLQRNPSKVKAVAKEQLVRITGQHEESYVFCSDEVFERIIQREREDAAYEARLIDAIARGEEDIKAGRFVTSIDEAFKKADALRKSYA